MKKVTLLFASVLLFAISCSDETTVFSEPVNDLSLESNEKVLTDGVSFEASGVLDILDEATLTGKTSKAEEQAGDYPLTLVAQINPPSFSGAENLTASHIDVDGNYAYVAYNTVEDGYAGAIDVINISDPYNPRITSRLYYTNADINSIIYDDGYVYAVGGVNSELSVTATSNSLVAKISAINGRLDTSNITYGFQEGFTATDVTTTNNKILVTSGKDGTVTAYDKTNITILNEALFPDLRAITTQDDKIAVLEATTGVVILDQEFNTTKEITINSDFGLATKRTLSFHDEHIIVAEGAKGAGVYNATSGDFIEYVPILINPDGVDTQDIVTNAVATNEEVLLMANGGAGLCLAEDNGINPDLVGIIALDGSINYVASKGDYVFAASGKAGLQIIKLNKPSESLEQRCATLQEYEGSANLNVNAGQTRAYRGSKAFNSLNIGGELLLCGTWTARNGININNDGLFEMNGTIYIGNGRQRRNVSVNQGATLKIEGNLVIYGDLTLNDGATLEFIGNNSAVYVLGRVQRSGDVTINGTFDDVWNRF